MPGEGVKIGINFNNKKDDDEGQASEGEEGRGEQGELTPGEVIKGVEDDNKDPAENPDLSSLTKVPDAQLKKLVGDVHEFKEDIVGKKGVSRYDTYRDKKSGYLFLIPKGGGKPIPTYYKA